jgi:hypothetical protein
MISPEDKILYSNFFHERLKKSVPNAVADALQKHKRNGEPIVVWRDGQIVEIPPEQIGMHQKHLEQ